MIMIDTSYLFAFFRIAAIRLDHDRGMLCALDGEIGDGDHGTSMANGFAAISTRLNDLGVDALSPGGILREAATAFIGEVGATVGPLYATGFLEAARCLDAAPLEQTQLGQLMQCLGDGIAARGHANLGDKTMLDVWIPAAQAALSAAEDGVDAAGVARAASQAAHHGAKGTISMTALRGRAARLKERSLGHQDPGATSAAMIIDVFCDLAKRSD